MFKFLTKRRNKDYGRVKNKGYKYLEKQCEEGYSTHFDILEWWRLNFAKYKV